MSNMNFEVGAIPFGSSLIDVAQSSVTNQGSSSTLPVGVVLGEVLMNATSGYNGTGRPMWWWISDGVDITYS